MGHHSLFSNPPSDSISDREEMYLRDEDTPVLGPKSRGTSELMVPKSRGQAETRVLGLLDGELVDCV